MGERLKSWLPDALAVAAISVAFLALLARYDSRMPGRNPDQYFHYAVSRLSAEEGLLGVVRSIPQVEDLAWEHAFPEKEFLFHRLTAIGWILGKESGVRAVCRGLGLCVVLLLYGMARRSVPPAGAAALVFALVLLNSYLPYRLGMVRPHVLGIFFTLVVLAGLSWRSRAAAFAAFAGGMGFALSYHAIYVPGALLAAFLVFSLLRRGESKNDPALDRRLEAGAGLLGLVTGVLANPYFPANVTMGLAHLKFALVDRDVPGVQVGAELLPLPSVSLYLLWFGIPMLAAMVSIVLLWRASRRDAGTIPPEWPIVACSALFFMGVAQQSPRAAEYGIPFATLALAMAFGRAWPSRGPGPSPVRREASHRWAWYFLGAITLFQGVRVGVQLVSPPDTRYEKLTQDLFAAIDALPPEASSRKVYNCDWNPGSFLLYRRPDVRFVDLLDPRFLLHRSREAFDARRLLLLGQVPDPVPVLRDRFRADYVLCPNGPLASQLDADPRAALLFPAAGQISYARLYELRVPPVPPE